MAGLYPGLNAVGGNPAALVKDNNYDRDGYYLHFKF